MTPIAEFLITQTELIMEKHKRQATGEAVQSLKEVITKDGIQIVGIDYWKYINEGRTSGGMPPVNMIEKWKQAKERRYGITLPPAWAIAKKIAREGAPTDKEGLEIPTKVLQANKAILDTLIKTYINGRLSINNK
jgi:hypothetical protein